MGVRLTIEKGESESGKGGVRRVTVVQVLDYYQFGAKRINSGTDVSEREFIGQRFDESSQLSYLQARYYDPVRGQFTSQDPVFWSQGQNLANPQSLNSYSYANNNPITMSDPNGQAASLLSVISSFVSLLQTFLGLLQGGGGGGGSGASVQVGANQSSVQNVNTNKGTQVQPPGGFVTQKTSTGCFDACAEMVGYRPDPANRIVTSTFNSNGQLSSQSGAQKGIQTIDSNLSSGKPAVVGVNWDIGVSIGVSPLKCVKVVS